MLWNECNEEAIIDVYYLVDCEFQLTCNVHCRIDGLFFVFVPKISNITVLSKVGRPFVRKRVPHQNILESNSYNWYITILKGYLISGRERNMDLFLQFFGSIRQYCPTLYPAWGGTIAYLVTRILLCYGISYQVLT